MAAASFQQLAPAGHAATALAIGVSGRTSSTQERTPPFYQLDLRMDKTWDFRRWDLSFYLDLQNATNAQNVEIIGYTDDYRQEDPVTGLPVIPAFGHKGEW